jgi:truncated hemoglobin YjbI
MTDSEDPKPPSPFEQLGGVAGVRALVDRFYVIAESR